MEDSHANCLMVCSRPCYDPKLVRFRLGDSPRGKGRWRCRGGIGLGEEPKCWGRWGVSFSSEEKRRGGGAIDRHRDEVSIRCGIMAQGPRSGGKTEAAYAGVVYLVICDAVYYSERSIRALTYCVDPRSHCGELLVKPVCVHCCIFTGMFSPKLQRCYLSISKY